MENVFKRDEESYFLQCSFRKNGSDHAIHHFMGLLVKLFMLSKNYDQSSILRIFLKKAYFVFAQKS